MFFSFTKWMLIFLINLVIFCNCFVNGADLPPTTTTMPYLSGCSQCSPFPASYSTDSMSSVKNVSEIDGTKCTQILSCNPKSNYSYGYPRAVVRYVEGDVFKSFEGKINLEVSCQNGKWYLSDGKQIFNSFDCQYIFPTTLRPFTTTTTPKNIVSTTSTPFVRNVFTMTTSTPRWGNVFTTTSTPRMPTLITTTTPSPCLNINISAICANKFGTFQRMTANANPSTSRYGNFAGFFKYRSACQKICKQNYKERCDTYMYEPKNRGTCTIFYNSVHDKIIENKNSTAAVFKRCVKPATPPNGSGDCCGTLVQSISSISADGQMAFIYNDDKCRSKATVTCEQPQGQGLGLSAGIMVNRIHMVDFRLNRATVSATCYKGMWQISQPPLNVTALECLLPDPS